MDYLPHSFRKKVSEVYSVQHARTRHLLLLGHEGLYLIERWRATRAVEWLGKPKNI